MRAPIGIAKGCAKLRPYPSGASGGNTQVRVPIQMWRQPLARKHMVRRRGTHESFLLPVGDSISSRRRWLICIQYLCACETANSQRRDHLLDAPTFRLHTTPIHMPKNPLPLNIYYATVFFLCLLFVLVSVARYCRDIRVLTRYTLVYL